LCVGFPDPRTTILVQIGVFDMQDDPLIYLMRLIVNSITSWMRLTFFPSEGMSRENVYASQSETRASMSTKTSFWTIVMVGTGAKSK